MQQGPLYAVTHARTWHRAAVALGIMRAQSPADGDSAAWAGFAWRVAGCVAKRVAQTGTAGDAAFCDTCHGGELRSSRADCIRAGSTPPSKRSRVDAKQACTSTFSTMQGLAEMLAHRPARRCRTAACLQTRRACRCVGRLVPRTRLHACTCHHTKRTAVSGLHTLDSHCSWCRRYMVQHSSCPLRGRRRLGTRD